MRVEVIVAHTNLHSEHNSVRYEGSRAWDTRRSVGLIARIRTLHSELFHECLGLAGSV